MFGGGPILEGRNEILLLGKAVKFVVIFQKYALKLIKSDKILALYFKAIKHIFAGGGVELIPSRKSAF